MNRENRIDAGRETAARGEKLEESNDDVHRAARPFVTACANNLPMRRRKVNRQARRCRRESRRATDSKTHIIGARKKEQQR